MVVLSQVCRRQDIMVESIVVGENPLDGAVISLGQKANIGVTVVKVCLNLFVKKIVLCFY